MEIPAEHHARVVGQVMLDVFGQTTLGRFSAHWTPMLSIELKMTPEEIWPAVTLNAARAIGKTDRGEIAPNKRADLVIWDTDDFRDVIYHYGSSLPKHVLSVAS